MTAGLRGTRVARRSAVLRPLRSTSVRTALVALVDAHAAAAAEASGPSSDVTPSSARVLSWSAARVFAFRRLRAELTAHGAPPTLVTAVRRAETDVLAAAERAQRGGAEEPWSLPSSRGVEVRDLAAVIVDVVVEGCVRDTYAAAVALRRAREREDSADLARDADDACRRADLAYEVLAWAWPLLTRAEQRVVGAATARAVDGLTAGGALACDLARAVYAPLAAALAA